MKGSLKMIGLCIAFSLIIVLVIIWGLATSTNPHRTNKWNEYTLEGIGEAVYKYKEDTYEGDSLRRYIEWRRERDPEWFRELSAYLRVMEQEKNKGS